MFFGGIFCNDQDFSFFSIAYKLISIWFIVYIIKYIEQKYIYMAFTINITVLF